MGASHPIFSLRGAEYSYPGASRPALCGIDLEVARGEWVALLGANGSGKSTLAKLCNALLLPTRGVCSVLGMRTDDEALSSAIRASVALVFQNPDDQIVASIVEEDVAFGPENLVLPTSEIRRRVDRALDLVGLTQKRRHASYSLSGGQKQRLALAGALALEPHALILDESTSMLDPEGRSSFLSRLGRLSQEGLTILQITHRMEEAISAQRVVVLQKGTVAWDGPSSRFFDEEYANFDFDVPPQAALQRRLQDAGLIPPGVAPDVDLLLEALCL